MNSFTDEETIFAAALKLPPEIRHAYLERTCGNNAPLHQRVEALLKSYAASEEVLEKSAAPDLDRALAGSLPLSEQPGEHIGRYKLLQQIGEGGYGVVYMAEQEEPVRRRVALKVIKLGMDTKQVIARFEAERQALALMDHPNIAKVLDAGATATGRPYFVMELVRGVKITEYCDHNNLPIKPRLELFIQVCKAIQHAHQKGIIHRDIKPSNILVTLHDGVAVPKVIDFGIAKATQGRLTDMTLFTAFEQFMGTPAYTSPEQAEISGLDIDTRSDIYSLGVMLYELLTGKTPFDTQRLLAAGLDAMRRTIREEEPQRPSTKLSTMVEGELTATARRLHTEPPKLLSAVRGDLDWIVMKCLEKDRSRRYESSNDLARDIERHVNQEPVSACPPGKLYRFQKSVRRNKLAFTAAAAILGALSIGAVVSTWQAIAATRARAIAVSARLSEAEERQKAIAALSQAQKQELLAREKLYFANVALANEALQKDHLGRARELLQKAAEAARVVTSSDSPQYPKEKDLRGWEWRYLWAQTRGDDLFILDRHDSITGVALWMPDGVRAVSCGGDNLVKLWNVDERRLINELSFPIRPNGLAVSPDGKQLAVGLVDGSVSLWDASSLRRIWQVELQSSMEFLTFSPNGEMIAMTDGPKVCVLWTKDGSLRYSLGEGTGGNWKGGLAFSPDSRWLAFIVPRMPLCGVLDLETGKPEYLPMAEGGNVLTLAFSPDGRNLVGGDPSNSITIWDWAARRVVRVLRSHHQQVVCVAFSPDGTLLASAGADQTIKLWDTRTWNEIASLRGHDFEILSVAFSPDGTRLISCAKDDTVRVWPAACPARRLELSLPFNSETLLRAARDGTNATLVNWYPKTGRFKLSKLFTAEMLLRGRLGEGSLTNFSRATRAFEKMAFAFRDGHIELWDLRAQEKAWSVTNRTNTVAVLTSSATANQVAVGYEDGQIDLLRLDTGAVERRFQTQPLHKEPMMAFSTNGKRLFAAELDRRELPVWNVENGQVESLHLTSPSGLRAAAFSDDGEWVVTTSFGAFASLWEVDSGRELARFTGEFTGFRSAAISPDKTRIALTSNAKGELSIWEPTNQLRLMSFADQPGDGLVGGWDPNGDNLVAFLGSKLCVWHAPSLAEIDAAEKGQPILIQPATWIAERDKWYRYAADRDEVEAQLQLGRAYHEGNGGPKVFSEALKWYRKAAEQGDIMAEYNVGLAYQLGEGVGKDRGEALKWYNKAAETGTPGTLNELAWLLATSQDASMRDGPNAVIFAEKAVAKTERKDPEVLDTLAACYAEAGQFQNAVAVEKESIALAQEEDLKNELLSRLKLYEAGCPYRGH